MCVQVGCFSSDKLCNSHNLASCTMYAGYTGKHKKKLQFIEDLQSIILNNNDFKKENKQ